MVSRFGFPNIVKKQRKHQQFRARESLEDFSESAFAGLAGVIQVLQVLDRQQRMLVHGIFMEEILNDMATNPIKLRKNPAEQSDFVHQKQCLVNPFLLTQKL